MFYTYILFSEKLNKYYIGSSNNPQKRLVRHNAGHNAFTKTGIPWILVYQESLQHGQKHPEEKWEKNKKGQSALAFFISVLLFLF